MMNPKIIRVTPDIVLKQIELADAEDIFHTVNNQRSYLGKWLPFVAQTKTLEDTKHFIRSVADTPERQREYVFVVHYNSTFAGLIGFKDTDRQNMKTEIGYWLSKHFQKKGIITQSMRAMVNFAFDELEMNRVQVKCAVANYASKIIPQRLGFQKEGIERDGELLADGRFTNLEIYSLLKRDR